MKVLLDTNLLSEPTKPKPDTRVIAWLDGLRADDLYTSTTSIAELCAGIERLGDTARRRRYETGLDRILSLLGSRVLPFDLAAAHRYGVIVAHRAGIGQPISVADAQIAAIAHGRGLAVATRNARDFHGTDVAVINPWSLEH